MPGTTVFDSVQETDPNKALESINQQDERVVEHWLESQGIECSGEEYVSAVSGTPNSSVAIPRFFPARTLEQTVFRAVGSALDSASRELYGDGLNMEVLTWDDEFNPQTPGNRILAEPAVLVSDQKARKIGVHTDQRKRMHNLDVVPAGEGYVLSFRNFGDFDSSSSMKSVEGNYGPGEPAFLSKALGIDGSGCHRVVDYLEKSSPVPEANTSQEERQREALGILFNNDIHPTVKYRGQDSFEKAVWSGGVYVGTDTEEEYSEQDILEDGMMDASGNYSYVVGPQQAAGESYIWNGGWPSPDKFRSSEARSFAKQNGFELRVPSTGDLASSVPEQICSAVENAAYSNCADQDRGLMDEAYSAVLLSDEVTTSDLSARYAGEIVRAEDASHRAPPLSEFADRVLSRVADTYGVSQP